jgi:nucleotidyltransferase substrate binding protein (TIGR01987 family)
MTNERLSQRLLDFQKAVSRLEQACAQVENSFIRDSVIQRFEFCWELAWKTLKLHLADLGIEALNPRDVIRQSVACGLIDDGNLWSEAQRQRNLTSHTYDEALSIEVYAFIRSSGLGLLKTLAQSSQSWNNP